MMKKREAIVHDVAADMVFGTAESALTALKRKAPDVILMDISLPGLNGVQALARFKQLHQYIPVTMINAF